jgi:hypothetical protein
MNIDKAIDKLIDRMDKISIEALLIVFGISTTIFISSLTLLIYILN